MEKIVIGGNVDSWCTSCKMMLAHVVVAKIGMEVKKVQCKTCKGFHNYRKSPPGTKTVVSSRQSTKRSTNSSKSCGNKLYQQLLANKNVHSAPKYSIKENYDEQDLLSHPKFGVGIVSAKKSSSKIEVIFEDGAKILVHGYGTASNP